MTTILDVDRCLTIAAYSAFVVLRGYLNRHSGVEPDEAIEIIRHTNSDDAGLDYIGGAMIHQHLDQGIGFKEGRSQLRFVVRELIRTSKPWWLRLVPYGREKVRTAIELDQIQCLREAGLFDLVPDADAVAWWDEIGALVRSTVDSERMVRAREAERLSLEYERKRLLAIGISLEPEWVSLEDNTLGYDIRSYDRDGAHIVSRLIEVKSTTSDAIFITRNEWRNATSAQPHYCFHIWKMPERQVVEYPVAVMEPNVPVDQGAGEWQDVRVALDSVTP